MDRRYVTGAVVGVVFSALLAALWLALTSDRPRAAPRASDAGRSLEQAGLPELLAALEARAKAGGGLPGWAVEKLNALASCPPPAPPEAPQPGKHRREEDPHSSSFGGWHRVSRIQRGDLFPQLDKAAYPIVQIERKVSGSLDPQGSTDVGSVLLLQASGRRQHGAEALAACSVVEVIYASPRPGHCVAVVETELGELNPLFVERFCRGSQRGSSCVAARTGDLTLVPRPSGLHEGPRTWPSIPIHLIGQEYAALIFKHLTEVNYKLRPLLKRVAVPPCRGCPGIGQVVAMATNAGNVHLILNWLCSARAAGVRPTSLIVFASDALAMTRLTAAGITAFHHFAFGDLPQEAAKKYGDGTFGKMMWLKTLAVFLPVQLGYTTLFQDADLVWFQDPWPPLQTRLREGADAIWQDDGARSMRFSPYGANSGFFCIAGTVQGQHFAWDMVNAQGYVHHWHSQQAMANMLLAEAHSRYGLDMRLLPGEDFPSGMHFHHRKELIQKVLRNEHRPYAFHMCWTQDGPIKVVQLKAVGWWYVDESCGSGSDEARWSPSRCCTAGTMANASGEKRAEAYVAITAKLRAERDALNRFRLTETRRRRERLSGPPAPPAPGGYHCAAGQLYRYRLSFPNVVTTEACHEKCKAEPWCRAFDSTSIPKQDSCRLGSSHHAKLGLGAAGGDVREVCRYSGRRGDRTV